MGEQGESTNILETLDSVDEQGMPLMFINKQVSIFEHVKDEIVEFLKTKSIPVLKELRDLVFSELVDKIPQYAGREMYQRRKADLLAEDIYVFGYSAINALPDRRLIRQCLKPILDLNSIILDSTRTNS